MRDSRNADKLHRWCKSCQKEYNEVTRDKRLLSMRVYAESRRSLLAEKAHQYYINNRDSANVKRHIYYQKNKHKIMEKVRQRKIDMVNYLGGCCAICNQIYDPCVYDFHHKDSSTKERSDRPPKYFKNSSWEKIIEELNKCICVCSNCHRIIHKEMRENNVTTE